MIERTLYKGTQKGVQLCIERNKTDVLSPEIIRASCTEKHEKSIWFLHLSGEASISTNRYGTIFVGHIENTSGTSAILPPVVVTSAIITAFYYDNNGKKHSFSHPLKGIWIEPGKMHAFSTYIRDDAFRHEKNPGWCSTDFEDPEFYRNCYGWDAGEAFGVEILTN